MEVERSSGSYTGEIADSLRFEEEIQSLIHPSYDDGSTASGGGSFTALLGLPADQAVELLHDPPRTSAAASSPVVEQWSVDLGEHGASPAAPIHLPPDCSPTFPSNASLVQRASRFSAFAAVAAEDSPSSSSGGGCPSSQRLKVEPPDSDSPAFLPVPGLKPQQRPAKRKDSDKSKPKGTTKKSKRAEVDTVAEEGTGGDKLPYVHVRVRRGQATDSHSLAERARREKINARMKLLQELVPGCSKITGTALVLDEIINHVQSLQRQVEFLSMRLAAVNPTTDFVDLESFLTAERESLPAADGSVEAASDAMSWLSDISEVRRLPSHKYWHVNLLCPQQSSTAGERDAHVLDIGTSLFAYDSANFVPVNSINQLKTEL